MSKKKESLVAESTLPDRELKFWITRQVERQHCWVVVARLGDMISHESTKIIGADKLALTQANLEYVYLADFHEGNLLTLVQDNQYYYVIRNKRDKDNAEQPQIESEITVCSTFRKALACLTSTEQKRLNIRRVSPSPFTEPQRKMLSGVISLDFVCKSTDEQKDLWRKFVKQQTETMDLSGFQLICPEILTSAKPNKSVTGLILYQNNKITNFEWLTSVLPNLKTLSIWYANMLQNEDLSSLPSSLQELEFHHCYQLTGRCLITLLSPKMNGLNKLVLDNPVMHCQENTFTTVITPNEWATLKNPALELLMLNSDGLTPDFAYYIIKCCPSLKRFVVADLVVDKLYKQTVSGYDKEEVVFQSFMNLKKGFKRAREIRFTDLLKDKYDANQFSDSMLKIIKSKTPKLQEDADKLQSNLST